MLRYTTIIILLVLAQLPAMAQSASTFNYATASHPLTIGNLLNAGQTSKITVTISNQVANGYFCLSNSVVATNELSKFRRLFLYSEGIPICPKQYRFSNIGEQLEFALVFNKFDNQLVYVNILEQCDANCLQIQGLVLDSKLNESINLAYKFFASSQYQLAADSYIRIINNRGDYPFAISYFNAIHAFAQLKDWEQASKWYKKLQSTKFADTQSCLGRLRAMPYFQKLL